MWRVIPITRWQNHWQMHMEKSLILTVSEAYKKSLDLESVRPMKVRECMLEAVV